MLLYHYKRKLKYFIMKVKHRDLEQTYLLLSFMPESIMSGICTVLYLSQNVFDVNGERMLLVFCQMPLTKLLVQRISSNICHVSRPKKRECFTFSSFLYHDLIVLIHP